MSDIEDAVANLSITPQTILCGCIAIPDTTRKRFRFKDKPNPKPFYDFSKYYFKQLQLIKKQIVCDTYREDLQKRLNSANKFAQFVSDLDYFYNEKKTS